MPLSEEDKRKIDQQIGSSHPDTLDISLNQAVRMGTPDNNAKIQNLAKSQRLPTDTVERNIPEVDARHHIQQMDVDGIRNNYPVVADFLRDPENAAVAYDDVDNLKAIEDVMNEDDIGFWSNVGRGTASRSNALVGNLIEFGGTFIDEYSKTSLPGFRVGPDEISWYWDLPEDRPSMLSIIGDYVSEGDAHRVGYVPRFTWERFKGDMTPTNLAGYIVEQGVTSLPDMLGALFVMPAYIASRTQEIAEQRALNDARLDPDIGDLANSIVVATGVSLLERLGAKSVFDLAPARTVNDVLVGTGESVVKEGGTEFLQEGLEYYGETVGTRTSVDHSQAFDRALAGAVAGSGFGGGTRATTATAQAINYRINRDAIILGESMDGQERLDEIITLAQESKLNELAQDRFKQFLKGAGREHGVYVSSSDLLKLVEEGQPIPEYLMNEAMQKRDGEIIIPLEDFVLDSELVETLRPYVRFTADQLSQSEIGDLDTMSAQDMIKKASELADIKSEIDEIYDLVKDQLTSTGRLNDSAAKVNTQLVTNYIMSAVEETGLSPREVYERMNFNVVGPRSVPPALDAQVLKQAQDQGYEGEDRGEAVEWVRAVEKGLDMSTEARMERAREMGFDTDQVWYHGTDADFNEFIIGMPGTNSSLFGSDEVKRSAIFLAEDAELAREFADQGDRNGRVLDLVVNSDNQFDASKYGFAELPDSFFEDNNLNQRYYLNMQPWNVWEAFDGDDGTQFVEALKRSGYDSVKIMDVSSGDVENTTSIAVFDPKNIRSVNAAFDPDYADSANLLAQGPTLYQAQRNNIGLYSQIEKVVADMRLPEWKKDDGTANGRVIWDKVSKSDGVKQEELKWLGLEEFLMPYADVDFRNVTVMQRDGGRYQVRHPIDDYEVTTTETIEETGETVEITESALERTRRLDKDISMIQKLVECMS